MAQIPKNRGFKSDKPKNQVVNLKDINKHFTEGAKINVLSLYEIDLINSAADQVKILGQGELELKNLEFFGIKFSQSAKEQVEKLGGKIIS